MGFKFDATGVDANGGYPIIEKPGWYPFRIVEAAEGQSKNGDYQVVVDAVCLDPRWKDYSVRHWVTFLPKENKGAGMALHFLKCIGEPFEGQIEVDPASWERKTFMGKVIVSEYDGKKNNKFEAVSAIKDESEIGEPAPHQKTAFDE